MSGRRRRYPRFICTGRGKHPAYAWAANSAWREALTGCAADLARALAGEKCLECGKCHAPPSSTKVFRCKCPCGADYNFRPLTLLLMIERAGAEELTAGRRDLAQRFAGDVDLSRAPELLTPSQ